MKRRTYYLTQELISWLELESRETHKETSVIVREALEAHRRNCIMNRTDKGQSSDTSNDR